MPGETWCTSNSTECTPDLAKGLEERYGAIFEMLDVAIIFRRGSSAFFNRQAIKLLGMASSKDIGDFRPYELSPPTQPDGEDSRKKCAELAAKALAGEPQCFPWTYQRRDGARIETETRLGRISIDGAPWLAIIVRDISDRARTEKLLQESEEKYRRLFEEALHPILLTDSETGLLLDCNQAACVLTGWTKSQILGKRQETLLFRDAISAFTPGAESRGNPAVPVPRQGGRVATKDGAFRDVVVQTSHLEIQGQRVVEQVLIDVTEQRRVEKALQESERKRVQFERAAATGQIAARIAHEINNPLSGIMNSFRLIRKAIPADHPYQEFANIVEKELRRIADIVRQTYEVHRPSPHATRSLNLGAVVAEVTMMLQAECRQSELCVETRLAAPDAIRGIPDAPVRQLLFNLVRNAIEASPSGGVVTVAARLADSELEITVADQGRGIAKELSEKVFEPFFTTKRCGEHGGLGMGLWVSKGIVESLRGKLSFESLPGSGTVFRVTLPHDAQHKGETHG